MTTKTIVDITSLVVAVSGGILAVANQITAIPSLPGWLTNSWPAVLAIATLIDRVGNIVLKNIPTDPKPSTPPESYGLANLNVPSQQRSQFATPLQGASPVNPAPIGPLPDPQAFRQPLGQPSDPLKASMSLSQPQKPSV